MSPSSSTAYAVSYADATPQRDAQAAHLAQLEDTIADMRTQYEQAQNELASKDSAARIGLAELTSAKQQAAQAEAHLQELQRVYENQSKELALLQVPCSDQRAICVTVACVCFRQPKKM